MKLACVTLDTEPDIRSDGYDIELFRDETRRKAFKDLLDKYDVGVTGFLVTGILKHNPGIIEQVMPLLPIRFESHSHSHDQGDTDSERELDETVAWYSRFFGRAPRGYRAPNGIISSEGLVRLAERGFVYDSSIFPSYRFDEYGYNNLHLPVEPFLYDAGGRKLVELPLASVSRVRLIVSLSYIKLLGWPFYKALIRVFGLPDILVINTHPYDFFVQNHLNRIPGWKRLAHGRNAANALNLFDKLLSTLQGMGYRFAYLDELIESLPREKLPTVTLPAG